MSKLERRSTPNTRRLLKAKEAARYLGISLSTLYRMERMGCLQPYRTPGGHRRYRVEMLDAYLEDSRDGKHLGGA
jgi:excisionase family DNA binding protein